MHLHVIQYFNRYTPPKIITNSLVMIPASLNSKFIAFGALQGELHNSPQTHCIKPKVLVHVAQALYNPLNNF